MKIYAVTDHYGWDKYVGKDVWVKCCSGYKLSPFDDKYEPTHWYIQPLEIYSDVLVYYRIYANDVDELMTNSSEFFADDIRSIKNVLEHRTIEHKALLKTLEICIPLEVLSNADIWDLINSYEVQV